MNMLILFNINTNIPRFTHMFGNIIKSYKKCLYIKLQTRRQTSILIYMFLKLIHSFLHITNS